LNGECDSFYKIIVHVQSHEALRCWRRTRFHTYGLNTDTCIMLIDKENKLNHGFKVTCCMTLTTNKARCTRWRTHSELLSVTDLRLWTPSTCTLTNAAFLYCPSCHDLPRVNTGRLSHPKFRDVKFLVKYGLQTLSRRRVF